MLYSVLIEKKIHYTEFEHIMVWWLLLCKRLIQIRKMFMK